MNVSTTEGWDDAKNHTSRRSEREVIRLVEEVGKLKLLCDHSNGTLRDAIVGGTGVRIVAGIHADHRGSHISVEVGTPPSARYKLYLAKVSYRGNTFVWQVEQVRRAPDPQRLKPAAQQPYEQLYT